jgi:hypothetical protein
MTEENSCSICNGSGFDLAFGSECQQCDGAIQIDHFTKFISSLTDLERHEEVVNSFVNARATHGSDVTASKVRRRFLYLLDQPLADRHRDTVTFIDLIAFELRFRRRGRSDDHRPRRHKVSDCDLVLQAISEVSAEIEDANTDVAVSVGAKPKSRLAANYAEALNELKELGLVRISTYAHWSVPFEVCCVDCGFRFHTNAPTVRSRRVQCLNCRIDGWWRNNQVVDLINYFAKQYKFELDLARSSGREDLTGLCHRCGSKSSFRVSEVLADKQTPCATCSAQPWGLVYLAKNLELGAGKVGRSTTWGRHQRFTNHVAQGWQIVEAWAVRDRALAAELEAQVIRFVRHKLGLEIAVAEYRMPQGGYTETFQLKNHFNPDVLGQVTKYLNEAIAQAGGQNLNSNN